jgi:LPXTG-motif cell wall-anchored protein
LHVWFPGEGRQADLTGWAVTWDAYWQLIDDDHPEPRIVADTSGALVYDGATCTPDTLLANSGEPIPVNGPSDRPHRTVLAEGYFGAANERTLWHTKPTGPKVQTGGTLPETGSNIATPALIAAAVATIVGIGLIVWATRLRRRRTE